MKVKEDHFLPEDLVFDFRSQYSEKKESVLCLGMVTLMIINPQAIRCPFEDDCNQKKAVFRDNSIDLISNGFIIDETDEVIAIDKKQVKTADKDKAVEEVFRVMFSFLSNESIEKEHKVGYIVGSLDLICKYLDDDHNEEEADVHDVVS